MTQNRDKATSGGCDDGTKGSNAVRTGPERAQQWLSDRCADLGAFFYDLCSRLDTGPYGVPCPDCGVPVDVGPDDPCPECEGRKEAQRRDAMVSAGAFDAGFEAGARSTRYGGPLE